MNGFILVQIVGIRRMNGHHILRHFSFKHLPPILQEVSEPFYRLAYKMYSELPPDPEVEVVLRKLLEAKDAAVRTKVTKLSDG